MLPPIEIPTLLFWENGNTWYGSKGQAQGNKGSCAEGLQRLFLHKNSPFRICIARHTGRAHAFPAAGQ